MPCESQEGGLEDGKRRGEGFERYYFSKGWVFPGWIGFSQWFKGEFGVYPPRKMLVELGKMSKAEREEDTLFGLYLWDNKHLVGKYHVGKSVSEV